MLQDEIKKINSYTVSEYPSVSLKNVSSSWTNVNINTCFSQLIHNSYSRINTIFYFKDYESFCLKDLNFQVKEHELVAIVGAVGSGKSSLLLTILNETNLIKGDLHFEGSAFYLHQEPWVFSASLKQNILFGKPFVKEKFNQVIKVCCLEHVNLISYKCQIKYFLKNKN